MKKSVIKGVAAAAASFVLAVLPVSTISAQEAEAAGLWDFTAGADLVSSYVWRGTHCAGASFQPSVGVSCGPVSLGAWGSTDFENGINEFDLALSFGMAGFTGTITDYFFPQSGVGMIGDGRRGGYFEWDKNVTGHQLELSLAYDFSEKTPVPLAFSWNMMIGGADFDASGDRLVSTYMELAYSKKIRAVDLEVAAGFTPWESMYQIGTGFNMVNLSVKGSYEIKFSDSFSLPVFAQAVLNPNTENVYMVFGLSF